AEVVKVERPGGEPMRSHFGPLDSDGVSAFYKTLNGGKTVVELNLKDEADHARLLQFVQAADVLLESFRPGVMERLGLAPERLRERHPRLVICSLSGYGQTGPYRFRAGHDINYLAFCGALASTGTEAVPVAPLPQISDYAGGMQALSTILAALVSRATTGEGAYLDVSLAESVLGWQSPALTQVGRDGYSFARGVGNESGGSADYRIYRTADQRFITLAALEAKFWENFCHAVDRSQWIARQDEPVPQRELIADVSALLKSKDLAYWRERLDGCDCCFETVLDHEEVGEHPQIAARQLIGRYHWPDPLTQVLYPAWVNGEPPRARSAPVFDGAESVVERWQRG
ncbi:MAG: CaiB/BaiF CoA transferase family protein, partial [Gammaproteobacteria bacterium]